MNQRAIVLILLAIIGIPALILIGQWSATDPVYAGISALLVVGIFILFQLGSKCWLLIPFFAAWKGSLNILPGHFAPRDLAVGLVVAVLILIWAVRRFPLRVRFGKIEIILLILLAFVGQAFMRNPTGLSIFGGSRVGGRPYFEIAISVIAFLVLSIQVVDLKSVKQMIFASFAGAILSALYETIVSLIPRLAYASLRFYQGTTISLTASHYLGIGSGPGSGTGRRIYLAMFEKPLTSMALSFRSPMQLLQPRNFIFGFAVFAAGIGVLLSGFRGGIADIGLLVIAAAFLHRRSYELLILTVIGIPALAALVILQGSVFNLPLSAQRALSFLPGDWDSRATVEAEGSTEWRIEMWKLALTNDRYIRSKWLGDGFGFTMDELQYQQELKMKGAHPSQVQDYYLVVGTYHSGPIETIKRIGYIGFLVLLIAFFVFAWEAKSLVNRSRGTPYFPYVMYVALPIMITPIKFVVIFGAFQPTVSWLLLSGGMLRIIETSLENWEQGQDAESSVEDGSLRKGLQA